MTRRQNKAIRQQVKASLIQIALGFAAGLAIATVLSMNL
jgi:ABC-type nitrate/sulfonate/bicarbonate transport system permease component